MPAIHNCRLIPPSCADIGVAFYNEGYSEDERDHADHFHQNG